MGGHGTMVRFTMASTWFNLVGMICSIIVLKWIPPDELGLWQSFLLIQTYALFVQGGVITGLGRELPFLVGKGSHDEAREMAAAAQRMAFAAGGLLLSGLLLIPFLKLDARSLLALATVLITSALNLYQIYLGYTYRGNKYFDRLANIQFMDGSLMFLSLPLVLWLGYNGLVLRYLGLVLIGTLVRFWFRPMKNLPAFRFGCYRTLFATGFPIFVSEYLLSAVNTFPRLVLLHVSGVLAVGLYAPANAALGLMYMLPRTLSRYVLPKMSHRFGQTNDPRSLWPMAWKSTIVFLILGAIALVIGWPLIPIVLETWFPAYAGSTQAARWCLVAGSFMGTGISINALYTLKAWKLLMIYAAVNALGSLLLPWLFATRMDSLTGATAGFALAQAIACVTALLVIRRSVYHQKSNRNIDAPQPQTTEAD